MPSQPPNDAVRIFLAYAREDFDAVSAIYDRLAALGLKPWMDKRDLLPGEKWEVHLGQAIQDSHFFLACLSTKSVEKRGYLQKEFKKAFDLWQEKLDSDIYLIPLRLDECQVPEAFSALQWANLYEKDSWQALLRAIRKGAERQGLPVPKGLVDQPVGYRRRTAVGSRWLLAGLAAIVVAAIAIIAYAAGVIPPRRQPPAPTMPLAGEGGGKETVGAVAAMPLVTKGVTDTTLSRLGPGTTVVSPPAGLVATSMTMTSPIKMELVRVPAGEFLMGYDPSKDSIATDAVKPQHRLTLTEFYIGKHEVTNTQFAAFVKATGHIAPANWQNGVIRAGTEEHPAVYVSWNDGVAFTEWLAEETGRAFRLCTEAEWEKVCRGASSLIYPWGDAFDTNKANTSESGTGTTTPVGKYSPSGDSPYGVSDMAGNVEEWVVDWYGGDYYESSPVENPQGPESGIYRVLRGGSFFSSQMVAQCDNRLLNGANDRYAYLGFRVCVSPGLAAPGQ